MKIILTKTYIETDLLIDFCEILFMTCTAQKK